MRATFWLLLGRLDRSRIKVIGYRRMPSRFVASAVIAKESAFKDAQLLELQSLQRSTLTLMAAGKRVSFLL